MTTWLRPEEITWHEGQTLCKESESSGWGIFSPSSRPQQVANVDWRLFRDVPRSDDIQQGGLGDCWFLSSLAVLAEFQGGRFLRGLLPRQGQLSPCGAYLVRLCLGGMWRGILIDDRLPCFDVDRQHAQLAYCVTKRFQMWASLIEKGFAKACGSYEITRGGEAAEALEMLTGWPCNLFVHGSPNFNPEEMWATLCSARDAGFLMTCSTKEVQDQSLESHHVYSLMDIIEIIRNDGRGKNPTRLVKIRNPHRKSKWKGDWADDSSLWTPELRQLLRCPEGGLPQVFFMSFQDFIQEFAHCTICRVRSAEWHEKREVLRLPKGAAPTTGLLIEVTGRAADCTLSLVQPGERLRQGGPFFPHLQKEPLAAIGFVVLSLDGRSPDPVAALGHMGPRPIISAECWLDPGRYILVPLSLHTGAPLDVSVACHSSQPLSLTHQELAMDEVREAWGAYAKALSGPASINFHGAELHLGKSVGGCVVAYAENLSAEPNLHFNVQLTFHSTVLSFSRRASVTSDWLAPGEAQVLHLATPSHAEVQVRWRSEHAFSLTDQAPVAKASRHGPPLMQNCPEQQLHLPFRPRGYRGGAALEQCVVQ